MSKPAELIEFIAKAMVDNPDEVKVHATDGGRMLELETNEGRPRAARRSRAKSKREEGAERRLATDPRRRPRAARRSRAKSKREEGAERLLAIRPRSRNSFRNH
jgi:hypothetical protein